MLFCPGPLPAEMTFGKPREIESDGVRGNEQLDAEIELRIETASRQRRQRLGDGLRHFG